MTTALTRTTPPRVLFFLQGQNVPSSRFRVAQFIPHFESHGIACTVRAPYPSLQGDVKARFFHGWRRQFTRPLSVGVRLSQMKGIRNHDLVYLQRPLLSYYTTALEEVVCRLRPAIFDIDDAIFHNFFGWERFKIKRIVKLCRHLVAGNQYLADFFEAPHKTTIIPTVVDAERFVVRPEPPEDQPFTIVWTGLSSNLKELAPVLPGIKAALDETRGRLVVVADRLDEDVVRGLPVDFVKWSPETEVQALGRAHVGIMPLRDTPYNRGKCGFKLIQYMARGMCVVAAPVGANVEIVRAHKDGLLANSSDDWADALVSLARDRDMRHRMGQSGRERVEQRYSIKAVLPQFLDLFARFGAGA
ncbi:MAG: glycosyltransferase family 4 protein [Deltaproteobacteria bacterium]|nr:glycosyltransferase family 4 protein [Deltaproteobacteria bacterium]